MTRPLCAMCGVNEADDCFTVCSPCWDIEHPKATPGTDITKVSDERKALESALFGGVVPLVSAECMGWIQSVAMRVKDCAEKEWDSGYSDGVDGYNREKERADAAEKRVKTMEAILGIVKRYAEVMGIVEIGHAITAATDSLDTHSKEPK